MSKPSATQGSAASLADSAVLATSPAPVAVYRSDEDAAKSIRDAIALALTSAVPGKASEASGLTIGGLEILATRCAASAAICDLALVSKGKKPTGKIPVHGPCAADALALAIALASASGAGAEQAVKAGNAKYREMFPAAIAVGSPLPLFKRQKENHFAGGQTAQHGARFASAPWNLSE